MVLKVFSLHIYPVKGCRAVDCDALATGTRGLAGDRLWMITDDGGGFLSQRGEPRLARIAVEPDGRGLVLTLPGEAPFVVSCPGPDAPVSMAQVWASRVAVQHAADEASLRLSAFLGYPVRLVRLIDTDGRVANPAWAGQHAAVSLADAYPVLITTTGSLAALNAAIAAGGGAPVSMDRFRPNIVVDAPAWAEDRWRLIRIGDVVLELVKPSDRCAVTTVDQRAGLRTGKEPLATLARLRLSADARIKGVLFGENAAIRAGGGIAVGDRVEVTETRSAWPLQEPPGLPEDPAE